ncbi:hypothetical protein AB0L57_14030 [Nocardia sp. NPDC052254]
MIDMMVCSFESVRLDVVAAEPEPVTEETIACGPDIELSPS